jgi:hypothetical protein
MTFKEKIDPILKIKIYALGHETSPNKTLISLV